MIKSVGRQQGLSLIEILISLVVLSVGLLGVAGMQATGMRNNHSSYTKTQASALAMDMADRIRANPGAAAAYVGLDTNVPTTFPAPTAPGCITSVTNCTPAQIAAYDKYSWSQPIINTTAPLLSEGRATITRAGAVFTITLFWREPGYDGVRNNCDGAGGTAITDTACLAMSF